MQPSEPASNNSKRPPQPRTTAGPASTASTPPGGAAAMQGGPKTTASPQVLTQLKTPPNFGGGCTPPSARRGQTGGRRSEEASVAETPPSSNPPTPNAAAGKDKRRKARSHPIHVRLATRPGVVIVVPPRSVRHMPPSAVLPQSAGSSVTGPPQQQTGGEASVSIERAAASSVTSDDYTLFTGPLLLCPDFTADGACPRTEGCPFVHADLTEATEYVAHERDATWTSIASIPHPMMAPGQTLLVAPPNSKEATDTVESQYCLKTKAFDSDRRPFSHCAHFVRKGVCDLGRSCQFVHAAFWLQEGHGYDDAYDDAVRAATQAKRPLERRLSAASAAAAVGGEFTFDATRTTGLFMDSSSGFFGISDEAAASVLTLRSPPPFDGSMDFLYHATTTQSANESCALPPWLMSASLHPMDAWQRTTAATPTPAAAGLP